MSEATVLWFLVLGVYGEGGLTKVPMVNREACVEAAKVFNDKSRYWGSCVATDGTVITYRMLAR